MITGYVAAFVLGAFVATVWLVLYSRHSTEKLKRDLGLFLTMNGHDPNIVERDPEWWGDFETWRHGPKGEIK